MGALRKKRNRCYVREIRNGVGKSQGDQFEARCMCLVDIDKCQMVSLSGNGEMHFTNTEEERSVVWRPIVLLPSIFNKFPIFYLKMKYEVILSGHFIPVSDRSQPHHLYFLL